MSERKTEAQHKGCCASNLWSRRKDQHHRQGPNAYTNQERTDLCPYNTARVRARSRTRARALLDSVLDRVAKLAASNFAHARSRKLLFLMQINDSQHVNSPINGLVKVGTTKGLLRLNPCCRLGQTPDT